jgi:hypothetical protein
VRTSDVRDQKSRTIASIHRGTVADPDLHLQPTLTAVPFGKLRMRAGTVKAVFPFFATTLRDWRPLDDEDVVPFRQRPLPVSRRACSVSPST